jgi:hypothetical protein
MAFLRLRDNLKCYGVSLLPREHDYICPVPQFSRATIPAPTKLESPTTSTPFRPPALPARPVSCSRTQHPKTCGLESDHPPHSHSPPTANHPQWHPLHSPRQLLEATQVPPEQSPAQNCKCRPFCHFVPCMHTTTLALPPPPRACIHVGCHNRARYSYILSVPPDAPPLPQGAPPWTVLTTMLLIGLDGQTVPRKHFGGPHTQPRFPDPRPSQRRAMSRPPNHPQILASTSPRTHNPDAMAAWQRAASRANCLRNCSGRSASRTTLVMACRVCPWVRGSHMPQMASPALRGAATMTTAGTCRAGSTSAGTVTAP